MRAAAFVAVSIIALTAMRASAQERQQSPAPIPPPVAFLMNDSMSMMDWGLYQLNVDVDRIVNNVNKEQESELFIRRKNKNLAQRNEEQELYHNKLKLSVFGVVFSFGWVDFNPKTQRLEMGFWIEPNPNTLLLQYPPVSERLSPNSCTSLAIDARRLILKEIMTWPNEKDAAEIALRRRFGHTGFSKSNQPSTLFQELARISVVLVKLSDGRAREPVTECEIKLSTAEVSFRVIAPSTSQRN